MTRDPGEVARIRLEAMCRERLQAAEDVEARMREFQKALDRYLAVCRDMEAMGYDSDVISADLCAPRDVTWSGDEFLEAERQRIEELRTVLHEMSRNRRRRRRRTPRARAVVW